MISSTQLTTTKIFTFIAVLVFNLKTEKTMQTVKSRPLFTKIASFTSKLLQNYK